MPRGKHWASALGVAARAASQRVCVARTPVTAAIALQRLRLHLTCEMGMRREGEWEWELAVGNATAIGLFTPRFEACLLLA